MDVSAFLSPDEVRKLIARSAQAIDEVDFEAAYAQRDEQHLELLLIAREGFRFAFTAAAAHREPALLLSLTQAIDSIEFWCKNDGESVEEVLFEAIRLCTGAVQGVEPSLEALVSHGWAPVRQAVARGLRPRTGWAQKQLEVLAQDAVQRVRGPAQEQLRKLRDIPWWGTFDSDPIERLSVAQARTHRGRFKRIAENADLHGAGFGEYLKDLGVLPEPLGAEAAWRLHATEDVDTRWLSTLFPLMLRRPTTNTPWSCSWSS
jgi:hypothetical protein